MSADNQMVDELMRDDRSNTEYHLTAIDSISRGSVYAILHHGLHYRKVACVLHET